MGAEWVWGWTRGETRWLKGSIARHLPSASPQGHSILSSKADSFREKTRECSAALVCSCRIILLLELDRLGSFSLLFFPEWQSPLKFGKCKRRPAGGAHAVTPLRSCLYRHKPREAASNLCPSLEDAQHAWASFCREYACREFRRSAG